MADWYPSGMDSRAAWHANFAAQLPAFIAKYNLVAGTMAAVEADNDWFQYWAGARHSGDALKQQLTKYFNTIAGKDEAAEPPAAIGWELPANPPVEVPPGIEARHRQIAAQIKGHMAFAVADGELMQIVSGTGPGTIAAPDISPNFTLRTLAEFALEATFKKQGFDALKFEYRYIGGAWHSAGVLLNSPGTFSVPPAVANVAQQVEVRAIFLEGNNPFGNFSDAKPAFIAP